MAAQPANTDIKVYPSVRTKRDIRLGDSVAAIIKHLRPSFLVVPGRESLVEVKTRDTAHWDFSPYMGQASFNSGRGFPIVIGLRDQVTFAEAQTELPDVDFAFQIGQDFFIKSSTAGLTEDLHGDARAL